MQNSESLFQKYVTMIIGKIDEITLEQGFFNAVTFLCGVLVVPFMLMDFIEAKFNLVIIDFALIFLFSFCYYMSRFKNKSFVWIYIVVLISGISYGWIFYNGYKGPSIYLFLFALITIAIIIKGKERIIVISLLLTDISLLYFLEFWYPNFVVIQNNSSNDLISDFISFLITFISIYIIILFIIENYNNEKKEVERKNVELVQQKEKLTALYSELNEKNELLEIALQEVKTLSGFIPICSSCKKIRNDEGSWEQIESYISQNTDAQFSHGICKPCSNKLYPDFQKGSK